MLGKIQQKTGYAIDFAGDTAHKTFMAWLGAFGLAQDELQKLYDSGSGFAGKLVERGEQMSAARRKQIEAQMEKRQGQVKDLGQTANATFDQYSEAVLSRANLPTSSDIQDLSKQVDSLSRKVDKIRREQAQAAV